MIRIAFRGVDGQGLAAARVQKVVSTLVKEELVSQGQRFMYFLGQFVTLDGDGQEVELVRLERIEYAPNGSWLATAVFDAIGDEILFLLKFYSRFLQAKGSRQMRIGVMLAQGITTNKDLRAGLRIRDLAQMYETISVSKEYAMSLSFFVHPDE